MEQEQLYKNIDLTKFVEALRPPPLPEGFDQMSHEEQQNVKAILGHVSRPIIIEDTDVVVPSSLRTLKHLKHYPVVCENGTITLQQRIIQAMKDERFRLRVDRSITGKDLSNLDPEDIETNSEVVEVIREAIDLMVNDRKDRVKKLGCHWPQTIIRCERLYKLGDGKERLFDVKTFPIHRRYNDSRKRGISAVIVFQEEEDDNSDKE